MHTQSMQLSTVRADLDGPVIGRVAVASDALVIAPDRPHGQPPSACCTGRQLYEAVQTLLGDVYLATDADGVIREANAAVSALFGGARTYILGKPLSAFVHREDRASLAAKLARLTCDERRPALWHGRLRPRRQAEALHVAARIGLVHDGAGRVDGLQWLLRDISAELAQAERLLTLERELERRVQARTAELEATVRVLQAQLGQRALHPGFASVLS